MKLVFAEMGLFLMLFAAWGLGVVIICRFFAAADRHDAEGYALREDHKRRKRLRRWDPQTTWDVGDEKPHRATRRKGGSK
jgi:hypothetical protein